MLICLGKEQLCAERFDLFRKRTTRKLWYGTEQLFLQKGCLHSCARPVIISTTDEARALTQHILQSKRLVTIATIHTENTLLSKYVYNVQTFLNLIRRVCNKIKTWILGYSFGPVTAKFFSKNFTNGYFSHLLILTAKEKDSSLTLFNVFNISLFFCSALQIII